MFDDDDDDDDYDNDDDDKPRTVELLQTKWNRLTAGGFDHLKLISLLICILSPKSRYR